MRVVIADDSALLREGLARLLSETGVEVLATVEEAAALEEVLATQEADVAIVDIRMPPTFTHEGAESAVRLRAAYPSLGILLLSQAIEIRGAEFMGWIADLSRPDPLFITPVLMGATMFWQQKIAPTSADPVQQRVMMIMPIMFTFMFLSYPSGLVIYWTISNLWAIGQQYLTTSLVPAPARTKS